MGAAWQCHGGLSSGEGATDNRGSSGDVRTVGLPMHLGKS